MGPSSLSTRSAALSSAFAARQATPGAPALLLLPVIDRTAASARLLPTPAEVRMRIRGGSAMTRASAQPPEIYRAISTAMRSHDAFARAGPRRIASQERAGDSGSARLIAHRIGFGRGDCGVGSARSALTKKEVKLAGKPGSVVDSHSSRRWIAPALKQPTRGQREQRQCPPIWPCSGWGLACHSCCQERGELLPGGGFHLHPPSLRSARLLAPA